MPTPIHHTNCRTPFLATFGLVFLLTFFVGMHAAQADITSNLLLHYTLDDNAANTTVVDSQGTSNGTASTNTNTLSANGKFNKGFSLSTTSQQYVDTNYEWSASDPNFTVSFWVKTTATGDNFPAVSDYTGQLGFFGINLDSAGRPVIAVYDTSGNNASAQSLISVNDNRWHFIVATLAGSQLTLYVDDLASTTASAAFNGNYRDPINNGTIKIGHSGNSDYFPGTIDDVRIYNRALSNSDIATLGGLDVSLFSWWKFDDGSGTNAIDSSGNGNTGTLVNSPTWVAGKVGSGALSLSSGSSQYMTSSNFVSGAGYSMSYSAWVYPTFRDGNADYVIGGTNNSNVIAIDSSGHFTYGDRVPSTHTYSGATIPLNQWTLLTVVCTTDVAGASANDTITMYMNGSQVQQDITLGGCSDNYSNQAYNVGDIGFSTFGFFSGYIDDVRLYDERALSSSDVSALYALGSPVSPPGISGISVANTTTTATITWTTDQSASSTVSYGPTSSYGSASTTDAFVGSHQIILSNLSPGTVYHYQVASGNTNGVSTSSDLTFTTAADVTPPSITSIASTTVVTTASVTWDTNEPATSKVSYGTVSGTYTTSSSSPTLVSSGHTINLSSLSGGTIYYYVVVSTDASGNTATSSEKTFLTVAAGDTTPPNITSIGTSTTDVTATITWTTNEAATSTVLYGITSSYGTASTSALLVSNHSILLSGLTSSTTYHFQIGSADASGNVATSSDQTFTTASTTSFTWCTSGHCVTFHDGDVVALVGDSISSINFWTAYFESYWTLHYPTVHLHFRDLSRSGAAIPTYTSGGQYMGQVDPLSPNEVILMMTNNGGFTAAQYISQVADFFTNYVATSSAQPVIFDVPPMNTTNGGSPLDQYSDSLLSYSTSNNIPFAGQTWNLLHTIWAANLASSTPVDIQDGGDTDHMGPPAHLGIAYSYLNTINADPNVSSTTISITNSNASLVGEQNAIVTNVATTSQGVDFTRLDARLPMGYDDRSLPIFKIMPQIYNANLYMLTVTGLSAGDYYVYVDGVPSGSVSSTRLAAGWNMSEMSSGPIHDQLQDVLGKIRTKAGLDRVTRTVLSPNTGVVEYVSVANSCYIDQGLTGSALKSCVATAIADVNALDTPIYTAAQPRSHTFSLRKAASSADTTPPNISTPIPNAPLAQGTTQTTLSVQTDEAATCKYDTVAQTPYIWMANSFTESVASTTHSANITGLLDGVTYTYYIRCQDAFGNRNMTDYTLTFSVNADPNPVAYWTFDEGSGSTAADSSGNNHTVTLQNSPTWVAGKVGSHALLFNGTNNAGTVGDISDADNIGALTVTAWVKGPGNFITGNGYEIVSKYASGQGPWTFAYSGASHVYACSMVNNLGTNATALGPVIGLNDTDWHLVACVYNGTNLTVYTDGATSTNAVDSPALTGVIKDTTYPVCIGTISDGSTGCQSNIAGLWSGTLDDIRIYKRALSANEVSDLFNQTAPVISSIATSTTQNTATISWTTDESASSTVNYGSTASYGSASTSDTFSTAHSITLTNLSPSTTYHFQVASGDSFGKIGTSSDMALTTSATVDTTPPIISGIGTSTTGTTATITWTTNETASSTILYGLTSSYGNASTSAAFVSNHSIILTGLTGATLYHFRVGSADTSGNVSTSSDLTLTTAQDLNGVPSVNTVAASSVSTTTATLNGSISDTHNFDAVQSGFAYGTVSDLHTTIATTSLGAQTGTASFLSNLTGLTANTTYYFRAYAANIQGTGYGTIQSFTSATVSKPTLTTQAASSPDVTTITANGTITATGNINPTVRGFVYGTTAAYGATTTVQNGDFSTGTFTGTIAGLTCGTTYHYAAYATNSQGIGYGNDTTFVAPCLASLTNISATSITSNSATITWISDVSASSKIDLGINTSYGSSTPEFDTSPRVTSHSIILTSLLPCTFYHYRVRSKDASNTQVIGTDTTVTTAGCTSSSSVSTSTILDITGSGGTLNAQDTSNLGLALTVPASFSSTTSQASFQAKKLNSSTFFTGVSAPSGLTLVNGYIYNLEALGDATTSLHFFDQPLTVSFSYSDSDITNFNANTLTIERYDGSSWTILDNCTVDTSAKTVTCSTTNFSDFGLFGVYTPPSGGGSSSSSSSSGSGGGGAYVPPVTIVQATTTANLPGCPKGFICTFTPSPAPTTLVPSTSWIFNRDLAVGSIGIDVKALQQFLNKNGFVIAKSGPGSPGNESTSFGNLTQAALIKFQNAHASEVLAPSGLARGNGYFGAATRALVINLTSGGSSLVSPIPIVPSAPVVPQTSATSVSTALFTRDLTVNSEGSDVKALQFFLNGEGYIIAQSGPGSPGNETTRFGNLTRDALIQFQKSENITPASGFFGPLTRAKVVQILKNQ